MACGHSVLSRALQALLVLGSSVQIANAEGDGPKKKKHGGGGKSPMPHHSFTIPMEYGTLLDDWTLSGASLFVRERMLLHPGVPEMHGFAWSKQPMLTDDFEATIKFKVAGGQDIQASDQSFAFWYVQDNLAKNFNEGAAIKAKSWGDGLRDQNMAFCGSKGTFTGMGTVFSVANKKQQVSLVTNDGSRQLAFHTDVPSSHAKEIQFRNTASPVEFNIRVNKTAIRGMFKLSPTSPWEEAFALDKPQVRAGGYIGFSAWSGSGGEGTASDTVSILGLDVLNNDETSIGEEMVGVSAETQDKYKEMLGDDKRHFADQKAQTEHMARLIGMVDDHLQQTGPAEEKLFEQIQGVSKRLGALGEDCGTLVKEAHLLLKGPHEDAAHHDHKAGVEAMKNDIVGLRKLLVKDSVTNRAKLEAVSKNVAEVKQKSDAGGGAQALHKIAKQRTDLEKTVVSRGSQMSWMLFFMVVAILGIGGLMFNRMQYYEKKHFL